jgi:hypothetical protein
MGSRWGLFSGTALMLALAACDSVAPYSRLAAQQTPTVRAINGGSAELDLAACPIAGNAAATEQMLHRLIAQLQTAGLLVTSDGGSAKLIIDLCS